MKSKPEDDVASRYRSAAGGHLLLRPFGIVTFAKAVASVVAEGQSIRQAVSKLSQIPFELAEDPWLDLVWRSETKTMVPKKGALVRDIMLDLANCEPRRGKEAMEKEYKAITGHKLARKRRTKRKRNA
jgi:hypothetical protein